MEVLLKLNWESYGVGRVLAKALSVDAATISRDVRYILNWRESLLKQEGTQSPSFVDAVIYRLILARIHPRHGYSWKYTYEKGVSSLVVRRGFL
jgi:hypothetical protein